MNQSIVARVRSITGFFFYPSVLSQAKTPFLGKKMSLPGSWLGNYRTLSRLGRINRFIYAAARWLLLNREETGRFEFLDLLHWTSLPRRFHFDSVTRRWLPHISRGWWHQVSLRHQSKCARLRRFDSGHEGRYARLHFLTRKCEAINELKLRGLNIRPSVSCKLPVAGKLPY